MKHHEQPTLSVVMIMVFIAIIVLILAALAICSHTSTKLGGLVTAQRRVLPRYVPRRYIGGAKIYDYNTAFTQDVKDGMVERFNTFYKTVIDLRRPMAIIRKFGKNEKKTPINSLVPDDSSKLIGTDTATAILTVFDVASLDSLKKDSPGWPGYMSKWTLPVGNLSKFANAPWSTIIGADNALRDNFIARCFDVYRGMTYNTDSVAMGNYRNAVDLLKVGMERVLNSLAQQIATGVNLELSVVNSVLPKILNEYMIFYESDKNVQELLNEGMNIKASERIMIEIYNFNTAFKRLLKDDIDAAKIEAAAVDAAKIEAADAAAAATAAAAAAKIEAADAAAATAAAAAVPVAAAAVPVAAPTATAAAPPTAGPGAADAAVPADVPGAADADVPADAAADAAVPAGKIDDIKTVSDLFDSEEAIDFFINRYKESIKKLEKEVSKITPAIMEEYYDKNLKLLEELMKISRSLELYTSHFEQMLNDGRDHLTDELINKLENYIYNFKECANEVFSLIDAANHTGLQFVTEIQTKSSDVHLDAMQKRVEDEVDESFTQSVAEGEAKRRTVISSPEPGLPVLAVSPPAPEIPALEVSLRGQTPEKILEFLSNRQKGDKATFYAAFDNRLSVTEHISTYNDLTYEAYIDWLVAQQAEQPYLTSPPQKSILFINIDNNRPVYLDRSSAPAIRAKLSTYYNALINKCTNDKVVEKKSIGH